jgi:hypothetical protein
LDNPSNAQRVQKCGFEVLQGLILANEQEFPLFLLRGFARLNKPSLKTVKGKKFLA